MKLGAVAWLLVSLLGEPLLAQTVRGTVVDASTGAAVPGAAVRLLGPDSVLVSAGLTGDGGAFILTGAAGEHELVVERIGYATSRQALRLRRGGFMDVVVELPVEAVPVAPVAVEVVGRLRVMENGGYYDRRRLGGGTFLERDLFMKNQPRNVGDVIQRVAGARVTKSRDFTDVVMRSNNWRRGFGNCLPLIYVDGMRMTFAYNWGNWGDGRLDLSSIPADDVEAVEVYTSKPSAPMQYIKDDSECGAILIWMRYGERDGQGKR